MTKAQKFILILFIVIAITVSGALIIINSINNNDNNTPKKDTDTSIKTDNDKVLEKEVERTIYFDLSQVFTCTNEDPLEKCDLSIENVTMDYNFENEDNQLLKLLINDKKVYEFKYLSFEESGKMDVEIYEMNGTIVLWKDDNPLDCDEVIVVFDKKGKILYNSNTKDYTVCGVTKSTNALELNFIFKNIYSDSVYTCSNTDTKYIKEFGNIDVLYRETVIIKDGDITTNKSNKETYEDFCASAR